MKQRETLRHREQLVVAKVGGRWGGIWGLAGAKYYI